MSSGFVSGGTTDQPTERDDEWLQAQKDIEATRRRKEEESRQEGGKTLYDVLQQNKVAKQEAFEESIRLKNQFRNLDEDEIEFLDSVLESTRAKEEAVKRETAQQLDIFRRQQEEADKAWLNQDDDAKDANNSSTAGNLPRDESQWAINARKRKRGKEEVLKGVKLRKSSTGELPPAVGTEHIKSAPVLKKEREAEKESSATTNKTGSFTAKSPMVPDSETPQKSRDEPIKKPLVEGNIAVKANLGLGGYSSEED